MREENEAPAVSVIMRTFNCFSGPAPYDPSAAIELVLLSAEDVKGDVELIVLDDGSTDQTLEKVRNFGDKIRLIEPGKMGAIPLLNHGIELARAPLIACFDSDDWVDHGYLAKLMAPFAWRECAYSFCDNLEVRYGSEAPEHCRLHGSPYLGTGVGGVIFRRSALLAAGGYDAALVTKEYYGYPEYNLLLELEKRGWGSSYIPEPLWTYVRRPGSMSAEQRGERMRRGREVLEGRHCWVPKIREY